MSITGQFEVFQTEVKVWTSKAIVYGSMGEKHADAQAKTAADAFAECAEKVSVIIQRDADKHAVVFPRDRNKPALVTLKSLRGYIAMWAVRQSPYTSPDGLAEVLEKFEGLAKQFFLEGIPSLPMRTFTERQLESFLVEYFVPIDQVQKWGERKNGNKAPLGLADCPEPDNDFIDLHALVSNIARSTWSENWEEP